MEQPLYQNFLQALHKLSLHYHFQRSIPLLWEKIGVEPYKYKPHHGKLKHNKKLGVHQPQFCLPMSEEHKHLQNIKCYSVLHYYVKMIYYMT